MFVEFDFEVKILPRCDLYLFLCMQQPSSFRLTYVMQSEKSYTKLEKSILRY